MTDLTTDNIRATQLDIFAALEPHGNTTTWLLLLDILGNHVAKMSGPNRIDLEETLRETIRLVANNTTRWHNTMHGKELG